MMLDNKYILSLSPDYVVSWGVWEAVRELLQNAIDQRQKNPESEIVFDYDKDARRLTVGSTNCKLSPKTLLLGSREKLNDNDTIGQFGEGYKLAMLVLVRSMRGVELHNGDRIWTPAFEHSEQYDEFVMTIAETEADSDCGGVFFHIEDVKQSDFDQIIENYLPEYHGSRILFEDYLKHKVFVGGLFVCEIETLDYGYSFAPNKIKLDRDRQLAPTFEVAYEASRLWSQHNEPEKLYTSMSKGALDTQYVAYVPEATSKFIVDRFLEEHPDSLPVSCQTEVKRHPGHKICLVPTPLRNLLRSIHKFVLHKFGTPRQRLEEFKLAFEHQLNEEGRRELASLITESAAWAIPDPPENSLDSPESAG